MVFWKDGDENQEFPVKICFQFIYDSLNDNFRYGWRRAEDASPWKTGSEFGRMHLLVIEVGYNRRSPAGAGLLVRGNGLWKVETFGIIGMDVKIVHPRTRQRTEESASKTCFHVPFT